MKGRAAFLCFAGLGAILLTGELYVAMRENAADEEVRHLNSIAEREEWAISGNFSESPAARFVEQGPLATPFAYLNTDRVFGHRLRANLRALPLRLRRNGKAEFDATVSTQRFGWRVTPQVSNAAADVLFFGDTFGDTVNDAETLPARFSAAFGGKALAHNFGVPGWGTAEPLALLENQGEKDELEQGNVTKVFYLLGASRTASASRLDAGLCSYSSLCAWLHSRFGLDVLPASAEEIPTRFIELVKQRYHAGVTVVLWNPLDARSTPEGVDVVTARTAIPTLAAKQADYLVGGSSPYANEPNARALSELGQYLAQRLGR